MGLPIIRLNLAPAPTLWRQHHRILSWTSLAVGSLVLASTIGLTGKTYRQAERAGKDTAALAQQTREAAQKKDALLTSMQSLDVEKELPKWRLAERILSERSLPWSRLTAELERSLVQDVRLRSIQRVINAERRVELKLKGEAKSREAEAAFVESLQQNHFFAQVILERENERQGGGLEFECTLPIPPVPPPYRPLPAPKRPSPQKDLR